MRTIYIISFVLLCSFVYQSYAGAIADRDFQQIPIPKNAAATKRTGKTVVRRKLVPSTTAAAPFEIEMVSSTTTANKQKDNTITKTSSVKTAKVTSKPVKGDNNKKPVNLDVHNSSRASGNARVSKAVQNEMPRNTIDVNPTNYRINLTPTSQRNKTTSPVSVQVKTTKSASVKNGNATSKVQTKTVEITSTSSVRPPTRRDLYACPSSNNWQLFALFCGRDADCHHMGNNWLCCRGRCLQGKEKQRTEIKHQPLLGVIERRCPSVPLAELWFPLRTCTEDRDCFPAQVCCPDGAKSYCRNPRHEFENLPGPAGNIVRPLRAAASYLQCTPPPPPVIDFNPRPCNTTADCFPNLCCQERGKKHCRPPQRNIISLLATMTQPVYTQWKSL